MDEEQVFVGSRWCRLILRGERREKSGAILRLVLILVRGGFQQRGLLREKKVKRIHKEFSDSVKTQGGVCRARKSDAGGKVVVTRLRFVWERGRVIENHKQSLKKRASQKTRA